MKRLTAIRDSVGGFIASKLTSWTWWKAAFKFYFWLFTAVAFSMFIVEEACQVIGFGRYTLISGKLYAEAAEACNYSAKFLATSRKLIRIGGIVNPMSGYVFGRYIDAEEKKLQWEMQRIEKELAKVKKRITLIENELRIRPIVPELITVSASPGERPPMPPKPQMSYPKMVDYETHAERLTEQAGRVWRTFSGGKYHKFNCRWLRKDEEIRSGVESLTRLEAIKEDLESCGTCRPK